MCTSVSAYNQRAGKSPEIGNGVAGGLGRTGNITLGGEDTEGGKKVRRERNRAT